MKEVAGIWLPDDDTHFGPHLESSIRIGGAGTYQLKKYHAARHYVKGSRHLALDIGAHVGLWSRVMAPDFNTVWAFEPLAAHIECFKKNTAALPNVELFEFAVGNAQGQTVIRSTPANSGNAHLDLFEYQGVSVVGDIVQMVRLDAYQYPARVAFMKIDVEGFEYQVLLGAEKLIAKDKPVIILEQKPNNAERFGTKQRTARDMLIGMGMREAEVISGDHIMVW